MSVLPKIGYAENGAADSPPANVQTGTETW
jgi:hypothetical protein